MAERSDPLSVHINADARQVWQMLREPANIAQWHGWQHPGLDDEIQQIYFASVTEDLNHQSLRLADAVEFSLEPVNDGTVVHLDRAAPADGPQETDGTQRWVTYLQQLRFALERHPNTARRTGYFSGVTSDGESIIGKLGANFLPESGESYVLDSPTGVRLEGRVWFRTDRQIGLTVASYAEHGDGLLILVDQPEIAGTRPAGGAVVHASMYGLGAVRLRAIWDRWEAFRSRHYPDSEPLIFPELTK